MPRRIHPINETTNKAHELADKALADPSVYDSPKVLAAIEQAARELRNVAGTNRGIADLVEKVEALVAAKR